MFNGKFMVDFASGSTSEDYTTPNYRTDRCAASETTN